MMFMRLLMSYKGNIQKTILCVTKYVSNFSTYATKVLSNLLHEDTIKR